MVMAGVQGVVDGFLRGEISAPVAAMELLLRAPDRDALSSVLLQRHGDSARLAPLREALARHSEGCQSIVAMLRGSSAKPGQNPAQALERIRRLFDQAVGLSEEASVALYSLGDPELLAQATREVVRVFGTWGVLGPERRALDIGCGIGRVARELAPRLRQVVGVELSAGMVAAARRRLHGLANVQVHLGSGRDLAGFADGAFELVYAIDVLPYVVEAGRALVETHFREVARVLTAGGDFVIGNYAYARPRAACAAEIQGLAQSVGLQVVRSDETPFRLWNGVGYQLRKPGLASF